MKKFFAILLALSLALCCVALLASCGGKGKDNNNKKPPACQHIDADDNGVCDVDGCGQSYTDGCDNHVDADDNGVCDISGCNAEYEDGVDVVEPVIETYVIEVSHIGGLGIRGAEVYVFSAEGRMIERKLTNTEGRTSIELDTAYEYYVEIDALPVGYTLAEETYAINPGNTTIPVTTSLLTEDISTVLAYQLGGIINDFSFSDIEGNEYSFSEALADKDVLVLNFWYINCDFCMKEFPGFSAVYGDYSDKVALFGINDVRDDTLADVISNNGTKYDVSFPLVKTDVSLANKFSLGGYPITVIIDRYGVICFIHSGEIKEADLRTLLDHFTAEDYEQKLIDDISDLT